MVHARTFPLIALALLVTLSFLALPPFAVAGDVSKLERDVQDVIVLLKREDPGLDKFFNTAKGYAVFPSVGKGAIGIGAARGKGLVYEKGGLIGETKLTQVTIGIQLGGQSYAEVIFFETETALDNFKQGRFAFSAQASAVAAAAGASTDAKYELGVLVFTMAKSGLMYEASVGGQNFSFTPLQK